MSGSITSETTAGCCHWYAKVCYTSVQPSTSPVSGQVCSRGLSGFNDGSHNASGKEGCGVGSVLLRLPQLPVFCEETRRVASSHTRSVSTEQIRPMQQIQDGRAYDSKIRSRVRHVGVQTRSPGCVFPHPCSPSLQAPVTFSGRKLYITVSSSALWLVSRSLCVYTSSECRLCIPVATGN